MPIYFMGIFRRILKRLCGEDVNVIDATANVDEMIPGPGCCVCSSQSVDAFRRFYFPGLQQTRSMDAMYDAWIRKLDSLALVGHRSVDQYPSEQKWNQGTVLFKQMLAIKGLIGSPKSKRSPMGNACCGNMLMKSSSGGALAICPYSQITKKIYLGDGYTAQQIVTLKKLGITHVLNAAYGYQFGQVHTGPTYYSASSIRFMGIPALDNNTYDISQYFYFASDYIDRALRSGGCIYIHCRAGVSRSATILIAYFMIKRGMTLENAANLVKSRRQISPNDSFLMQLCRLDRELKSRGADQR
ncbi:hypothetical protein ACOME3_003429 [Neoechinorhynchus agilis]